MDHLMKMTGRKSSFPPLGLLTVAALLPEEWNKRLVDLNVRALDEQDLKWADYAFVGATNVQALSAQEVIAQCRQSGVQIVAGGPLFTHEYQKFKGVDHFVLNEAEVTLPQFLRDLETGDPKPVYSSSEFADMHQTPIPLWQLVDLRQYAYAAVQYSRGCPYQCDFCDVTSLFGRRPRTKTPDQIIAELEALGDLRIIDMVLFADDNLIGNKKRARTELLPALIEWQRLTNPPVGLATQVTIELADDPETIAMMREAGFSHIFVGIETPEENTLVAAKKRQNTRRDMLANVRMLHESGFVVNGGFIVGFDTDTPSIFQRQIDFIRESGIVIATVNLLKAPPGTELYDRMKREGRLLDHFDFDEAETNIIPAMGTEALHEGYEYVLKHVCLPEYVYQRAKTFFSDYGNTKRKTSILEREFRLRDVGTFFRILFHLGIMGKERIYFWRLFLWTLFHYPEHLDLGFLFAVLMRQFRSMYDGYVASSKS